MSLRLQMSNRGAVRPYPYFVNSDGLVERQDFWRGTPHKLVGFCKKRGTGELDLPLFDFLESPQKAVGMYPVFENKNGEWGTYGSPIESIGGEI